MRFIRFIILLLLPSYPLDSDINLLHDVLCSYISCLHPRTIRFRSSGHKSNHQHVHSTRPPLPPSHPSTSAATRMRAHTPLAGSLCAWQARSSPDLELARSLQELEVSQRSTEAELKNREDLLLKMEHFGRIFGQVTMPCAFPSPASRPPPCDSILPPHSYSLLLGPSLGVLSQLKRRRIGAPTPPPPLNRRKSARSRSRTASPPPDGNLA